MSGIPTIAVAVVRVSEFKYGRCFRIGAVNIHCLELVGQCDAAVLMLVATILIVAIAFAIY